MGVIAETYNQTSANLQTYNNCSATRKATVTQHFHY